MASMPEENQLLAHKNAGTEFFKQGKFEDAIDAYTAGIELAGGDVVEESMLKLLVPLLSNRSLCYGKLNRAEEALKDADEVTDIDPTFAKGWIRRASALQALGRLKDAVTAYDEAIKLEPSAKSFKKARKQVKDAVKQVDKQREEVSAFAQSLVVEAMKIPEVDPNACCFAKDGETLNIAFKESARAARGMHVPSLYTRFARLTTEEAKAKFLTNAVQTYVVADPSESRLPEKYEAAMALLRVHVVSNTGLKQLGDVACIPLESIRGESVCGDMCDNVESVPHIGVVVVVDRAHARFFVTKPALARWGKSFQDVYAQAVDNMKHGVDVKCSSTSWKSHPSGCATSPWNDGLDAARVAIFPSLAENAKADGGADDGDRVVAFGANNCVLTAGAQNPIGLCFCGDIVCNDIGSTGDLLSNVPYRLNRIDANTFQWTPYLPQSGRKEFSVPAEQSEIDAILEAVQSGRSIPVFASAAAPINKASPEGKKSAEKKAPLTWDERAFVTMKKSVDPSVKPPAKQVVGRLLELAIGWSGDARTLPNGQVLPGWIPAGEIKDTQKARLAALRVYCQIRDKTCIDLDRKVSEAGGFYRSEFADRIPRYRRPIMKVIADFGGERTLTILSLAQKMTLEEAFSVPIAKRSLVQLVHNIMHIPEMQQAGIAVQEVLSSDPAFRALLPDVFGTTMTEDKENDDQKIESKEGSKADDSPPKALPKFIPMDAFSGPKQGYVFKSDTDGTGYYLDDAAVAMAPRKKGKLGELKGMEKQFKQGFLKSKPGKKKVSAPVQVPKETTTFTVGGQTFSMNADMDPLASLNDGMLDLNMGFNPNAPFKPNSAFF